MQILQNEPSLWRDKLPLHAPKGHKYDRGIAVIFGAPKMTGATRLSARAAARMGAGLVKVIAPKGTGEIYRSTLHEEIIVVDAADFEGLGDPRVKCVLIGPGFKPEDVDQAMIGRVGAGAGIVLDAGAIAAWKSSAQPSRMVITPHEGEFSKIFPDLKGDKVDISAEAARLTGATVVLKGAQTVIAGESIIIAQDRAVPELATAGTGDVLAGMIAGLITQGMETKWAAAAAVWIHAEVAQTFGRGMVAGDIPEMIPEVLRTI